MVSSFTVTGLATGLIQPGDNITGRITGAMERSGNGLPADGDIFVLAESMVATAEGRVISLQNVNPSLRAQELAARYRMDPRIVEVVLWESDEVIGGIPNFLLCMKGGTLLPNAGVDGSNAPSGCLVPLPADPDGSAERIRMEMRKRCCARVAVIIADSRVHAMRSGCSGIAIGCSGMQSVTGDRGRPDLFERPLHITQRAVADMIASAAEIVMGEADEGIPVALVRGLAIPMTGDTGVNRVSPDECLFMMGRGVSSGTIKTGETMDAPSHGYGTGKKNGGEA